MRVHRKENLAEREHLFYEAMGEIDCDILYQVEKMQQKPVNPKIYGKKQGQQKALWAAVACFCLLGASHNGSILNLVGGGRVLLKENGGISGSFVSLEGRVYSEKDGLLQYHFESSLFSKQNLDITAYCSDRDYYLVPQLDEGGTGYVMAVGGRAGNRGSILAHYQQGTLVVIQGDMDRGTDPELFSADACPFQDVWARHFMNVLGKDGFISSDLWGKDLGDLLITDYGMAEKVTEQGYWIQGYDQEPFTLWEAVSVVMYEMRLVEGAVGGGMHYEQADWNNLYNYSLTYQFTLSQEETPIDLEAAHEILRGFTENYVIEVSQDDIEIVVDSQGNTHEYHTPRLIYQMVVSEAGRELTMAGPYDWMAE